MATVGVYMIVRDEESVIARCLDSVLVFADEVVVVDTGSVDSTKRILEGYSSADARVRVYDFPWIGDFSAARNFALSKVESDYCYQTDADEVTEKVLADEINRRKANGFGGSLRVNLYLTNVEENGEERPIFGTRMLVHRSLNPVWRHRVHEKLYTDKVDGCESSIPLEVGSVRHKKHGGTMANFLRYMEMYYKAINENDDIYLDSHFCHYFYITCLWNDIPMCKRMLSNIFKPEVIDRGDDLRETIRLGGNVTDDEWFTMNAIADEYSALDEHRIKLIHDRSMSHANDCSRYLASEWFVRHSGMEKFDPYMEEAISVYFNELLNALRPKDYVETFKLMETMYPNSEFVKSVKPYAEKVDNLYHNTMAVVVDGDGFDTLYHYASRCFDSVMVVTDKPALKLSSNRHCKCDNEKYAMENAMYVRQIPSVVMIRNTTGHTSMENFKAMYSHFISTNNHIRGYIGFKREYVLDGTGFSVNYK